MIAKELTAQMKLPVTVGQANNGNKKLYTTQQSTQYIYNNNFNPKLSKLINSPAIHILFSQNHDNMKIKALLLPHSQINIHNFYLSHSFILNNHSRILYCQLYTHK